MIPKDTIEIITETARIEEVVGDFVNLKRRGANMLGLCPFHNEKTPSFTVSPAKGIFKCFGCGKAGNSVNFIMEHEHFSYPEALRYLARKYNIHVEEETREYTPEEVRENNEKESLFVISSHAAKYFSNALLNTEEGRNIGLSYFRERGFTDETIEKFQLGFSPQGWSTYSEQALKEGFKPEHLTGTGLGIEREGKFIDRFHGRVMFPIHSLAGRILAFGGRTLLADKKTAKYLNSPESLIYSKSKVLYGIFYSRKAISSLDNCFLVEGYTDVISLFQAGIENVVASSGTSLTTDQIRLIKRYTDNITILYDGDAAGIKASLRGINMILEQGMNVKIVLFPEGEDPDSYARKNGGKETKEFLSQNAQDFVVFKASLLKNEAGNDPIKKASLIRDIVETIALIPDNIARSVYARECASIFEMEETTIIQELNKFRRNNLEKKSKQEQADIPPPPSENDSFEPFEKEETPVSSGIFHQERDLIRLMLTYGDKLVTEESPDENGIVHETPLAHIIIEEFATDNLHPENPVFRKIFDIFTEFYSRNEVPSLAYFLHHEQDEIKKAAIDFSTSPYQLSEGWEKHNITVNLEDADLHRAAFGAIYSFKIRHVALQIQAIREKLKSSLPEEEEVSFLQKILMYEEAKKHLSALLGRIVLS